MRASYLRLESRFQAVSGRVTRTSAVACGLGPSLYWRALQPAYAFKGSVRVVWRSRAVISFDLSAAVTEA